MYSAAVAAWFSSGSGVTVTTAAVNSATEPNGFTGNNQVGVYNNGSTVSGNGVGGTSQGAVGQNSVTATAPANQGAIIGITNNSWNGPNYPSGSTTGGSIIVNGTTTTTLVFLGTIVLNVGSSANETFTVSSLLNAPSGIEDAGSTGNTLTSVNFYDLDVNSSNPAFTGAVNTQFTIQTSSQAPEPSSMLLCGFAACSMGFGYWRRRKAKLAAAAAEQPETPSTV